MNMLRLSPIVIVAALAAGLSSNANGQAEANAARGKTLYQQRCASCHSVTPGKASMGPNLAGVVGRKAGATSFRYSPALKNSGVTWSVSELDAYLAAPTKRIPGVRMVTKTPAAADRRDIVGYLTTTK